MSKEGATSVGPFGGGRGNPWDDGRHSGIRQVRMVYSRVVDSITFEYENNGVSTWSAKHGGEGGHTTYTFSLNSPDEYLISVSGQWHDNVVGCLTFQTNYNRIIGPLGTQTGPSFFFPSTGGKIVGFHGRSTNVLDAIGAHIEPLPIPTSISPSPSTQAFKLGPFGGSGGSVWDDGPHSDVRKIQITYGSLIDSIRFEYESHGSRVWSARRGGNAGPKTYTVDLARYEHMTSVSGFIRDDASPVVLRSITLHSNWKRYGPIGGSETGRHFIFPSGGGKIVGFHGRAGGNIDAIGAYTERAPTPDLYRSLGPFGGAGGNAWDDGVYAGVRTIEIFTRELVHGLRFEYVAPRDRFIWSPRRGTSTAGNRSVVSLNYPEEFLTSISGFFDQRPARYVLSLTFKTNKKTYGPYGPQDGVSFSIDIPETMVVGFHGRSGWYIDSIGAHLMAIPKPTPPEPAPKPTQLVGPFGGKGGKTWDDGVHDGVKKITIGVDEFSPAIHFIRFEYIKDGRSVLSQRHGGEFTGKTFEIEIEHPDEYLISVSGYHEIITGFSTSLIQSLKFQTNKRTFGPYGTEQGTIFSFGATGSKIVGFHGRADVYLDAIGAILMPLSARNGAAQT